MAELLGGRYRVLSVVGRGGEASVLQAVDTRHDRPVALKVRPVPLDEASAELQLTEARRLLSLPAHDGLAHARDDFYEDGRHVLVLDWVDGIDLARLLSDEGSPGLPLASVLRWLAQAAEALTALHRHDVVHGDVKPANLVLDNQGRVVVVDLGSSSVPGDLGPGAGTPGFRAPELAAGEPPTRACDVYGLAATAFALLTGSAPAGVLPDWERLVPNSGHVLEDAIRAGLSVAPERRPATPGELVERLRAGVDDRGPTGVITVLLTDVVGSTELWQRIPAQMPGVLARMQLAVDAAVDRHNGVRLGATVEGDSTVSGFARADDAVGAAVALQRALRLSDPDRPTLSVRAGLATGEVVAVGGDVIGPTLSRAARVRDLAGAGEVFLSETTSRVVAPALPAGIELVPLGLHALRGIEGHDDVHAVAADGVATPPDPHRSPYPGLAPFGIDDAAYYVGREDLITDALRRLRVDGFVGLVGASGTGKSSLALAGLGPLLAAGGDALAVVTPGAHPLAALDAARAPADGVLVVDQLEEVVTLCRDRDERAAFLERLADRTGGTVVTLRSDVYGALAGYGSFSSVLAANHLLVGSPSSEDLRRAIVEPAARSGLRADPGLVDVVLAELGDEPGRLPLLAHALRETWERREGRNLTLAGYRAAGGVEGAIAHTADAIVDAMPDDQRKVARWALLEMVELRDDGDDTRRWLALSDVDPARRERTAEALDALAAARLVVIDADRATLAHEALLAAWPRLRAWIDEERAGLVARQHVRRAAAAWVDGGRGSADLYRGARLAGALDAVSAAGDAELSPDVGEFLAASRANEELELAGARRTTRRLRSLLAGVSMFAVVALVAGVVALRQRDRADTAATQADAAAELAEARRIGTQALVVDGYDKALLLGVEGYRLRDSVETRSNLLTAIERSPNAVGLARNHAHQYLGVAVTPDGKTIVASDDRADLTKYDAATLQPQGGYDTGGLGAISRPAISADGRLAVIEYSIGDFENRTTGLRLVDLATMTPSGDDFRGTPVQDDGSSAPLARAAISPDGRFVAAVTDTDRNFFGITPPAPVALVWDASHRDAPIMAVPFESEVQRRDVLFTPDGSRLLVTGSNGTIVVDLTTGRQIGQLAARFPIAVSLDGKSMAGTVDESGVLVGILNIASGEMTAELAGHAERVQAVAFSESGDRVATAGDDRIVMVWSPGTGERLHVFEAHSGQVQSVSFAPDGSRLYSAGQDGQLFDWDLIGARTLTPLAEPRPVPLPFAAANVLMSSDASTAIYYFDDGRMQIQDLTTGHFSPPLSLHGEPVLTAERSPDKTRIAIVNFDGTIGVIDADTGDVIVERPGDPTITWGPQFTPDGETIIQSFADGRVQGFDADTLEPDGPAIQLDRAAFIVMFQPDGRRAWVFGKNDEPLPALLAEVDLIDHRVLRRVDDLPDFVPFAVDITADNRTAILTARTGLTSVVNLETGSFTPPIKTGDGISWGTAFSPDGETFVTSGVDGNVRLWDVATRQLLGRLQPVGANHPIVADFDATGRVVMADAEGPVYIFDPSPEAWVDYACRVAGRNFTTAEWADLFPDRAYHVTCPQFPPGS